MVRLAGFPEIACHLSKRHELTRIKSFLVRFCGPAGGSPFSEPVKVVPTASPRDVRLPDTRSSVIFSTVVVGGTGPYSYPCTFQCGSLAIQRSISLFSRAPLPNVSWERRHPCRRVLRPGPRRHGCRRSQGGQWNVSRIPAVLR